MSNNFGKVLEQLQKNPKAFDQTQLLSISIDPENDKPAVLRSYGERYVGRIDPKFQHWQFASGSPEQVTKAADFFGLAYNSKDGQIVHGLHTVLIGKDGKVVKVYSGNDWKPEDVAADFVGASIHSGRVDKRGPISASNRLSKSQLGACMVQADNPAEY